MTPEAVVKNAVKKILTEAGVYFIMPFGGGYGRSGVADIVACVFGIFLAIECKAPGGRTTALQKRELQRVRDADGLAIVISGDPADYQLLRDVISNLRDIRTQQGPLLG